MITATFIIALDLIADIAYGYLDPRVRYEVQGSPHQPRHARDVNPATSASFGVSGSVAPVVEIHELTDISL